MAVVVLSSHAFRAARRHQARERERLQIESLHAEVLKLQNAVFAWADWWTSVCHNGTAAENQKSSCQHFVEPATHDIATDSSQDTLEDAANPTRMELELPLLDLQPPCEHSELD
eukprot:4735924-Amphidinium_carterae.1